jgi:hypothetical protein
MSSQIKDNYLNEVKRLRVLEELVKETQKKIDGDFIKYYRAEKPADVEALEKYLNAEIEKLLALQYKDDYNGWCDVVLIKTKDDKIITFDISRSNYWEKDEEAIILEEVEDGIADIIRDIFEDFPYTGIEYV